MIIVFFIALEVPIGNLSNMVKWQTKKFNIKGKHFVGRDSNDVPYSQTQKNTSLSLQT